MTISGLTTLDDGAYRMARIGLRVLRGDGDPANLPGAIYERLRKSVEKLDPAALGRAEAAILAVPEAELLTILEGNLDDAGQNLNSSGAAGDLASRPDVIAAIVGGDVKSLREEAKFAAATLGLGVSYMVVESYMERIMADLEGEQEQWSSDTLD